MQMKVKMECNAQMNAVISNSEKSQMINLNIEAAAFKADRR